MIVISILPVWDLNSDHRTLTNWATAAKILCFPNLLYHTCLRYCHLRLCVFMSMMGMQRRLFLPGSATAFCYYITNTFPNFYLSSPSDNSVTPNFHSTRCCEWIYSFQELHLILVHSTLKEQHIPRIRKDTQCCVDI